MEDTSDGFKIAERHEDKGRVRCWGKDSQVYLISGGGCGEGY